MGVFKKVIYFFPLFFIISLFSACAPARSPIPPGVVPNAIEPTVSDEQYGHQILSELSERFELDYNHPKFGKLVEIIERLSKTCGGEKHPWHVYLFKGDNIKNAAAARGNHLFIWTGILNAVQSDDELAAVLSHEMAHVISRHTEPDPNDQIKKILIEIGAAAAGVAVASVSNPSMASTFGRLTSGITNELATGVLIYPYSKEMELEADRVGLLLMASAKYDPTKALEFWKRMGDDPDFQKSGNFFSTHPATDERIENLRRTLPEALKRYTGDYSEWDISKQVGPKEKGDTFDFR